MPLPRVLNRLFFFATHKLGFWVFHLGWSYRCAGRSNLPAKGPALLVSNHQSFLDPFLVGLCARRPLAYIARHNLFEKRLLAFGLREFRSMPIDRDMGKDGLQLVFDALAKGEAVTVFAEGERTHDGALQPLKPGIALLAKRADVPVVPCAIVGAYEAWPRQWKRPKLAPLFLPKSAGCVAVVFGEAVPAGYYRSWKREAILNDLQARLAVAFAAAQKRRRKR
jgi:1-acyl-sn-glycerol-3-phosphate acyltransferase